MRCDNTVRSTEEGVIRKHGFHADDIAAVTAKKAAVQCFADSFLINDGTSGTVYEECAALEVQE